VRSTSVFAGPGSAGLRRLRGPTNTPLVPRRPLRLRPPGADYSIIVVGDRRSVLRDFYHLLLQRPWRVLIATIISAFLIVNTLFALAFMATGGIAPLSHHSFPDAFFFSVQTMGTIGYGAMYPASPAANLLVVVESIASLLLTAVSTGLVFSKFSRSTAAIVFSETAVIAPMNGVPTLMFRMGNMRGNQIVDVQIRVAMVRTERTTEGGSFYRTVDLKLTRERAMSLQRSWSVQHPLAADSPLVGQSPESLAAAEAEMQIMVVGLDDITMQPVHASHRYFASEVQWGARYADILSETPEGDLLLDLDKFHHTEPTVPTADFPFPRAPVVAVSGSAPTERPPA
jgi:inward rectifier potassium channel